MALSDTQKFAVLKHLGWPANSIIEGSTSYNKTIVDRLGIVESTAETKIAAMITALDAADTKLAAAQARALVKRIGDIELNNDESRLLMRDKRRLINELSKFLDIKALTSSGALITLRV